MTPFQQAQHFYAKRGLSLAQDCYDYLNNGWYVVNDEKAFILARPDGDTLWIQFAAGDMASFFESLASWLTYVSFNRRNRTVTYTMASLVNKIL